MSTKSGYPECPATHSLGALAGIFRSSPVAASITELKSGRYIDVNESFLALFGFTREEIIGRTSLELGLWLIPRDRGAIMKRLRAEGPVHNLELRWRTKSGKIRDAITSFEPFDLQGTTCLMTHVNDVTGGRQAERDLDRLFTLAPVLLSVAGTDGYFKRVNPAFERVLGYSQEELLGGSFLELVHPDDRSATLDELGKLADGSPTIAFENRYRCKDQTYRWLSWEARPLKDEGLIYGVARDITDEKRAKEGMEVAKAEAERANLAKSDFLSRMSHELRTPLNAILGFGQLLELDPLAPEQAESVGYIIKAGRHLLSLIDEVLDIARIESNRLPLSIEPVEVADVVGEVLQLMGPFAEQCNVRLAAPAAACECHVLADRQRLKQVLLNLISNAVKYNRADGVVEIGCEESGDGSLRVFVTDSGRGISPENMLRLFTPFDRLGADATGVTGTGLGLALSKALVEAMQGTIGAESTLGDGTTFWVDLPTAGQQMVPDEAAAHADGMHVIGRPAAPRLILYIEDNLASFTLVERVMARQPHVILMPAMQGRLGLELARQHRPDLVILDINLPDMMGDEVLRELRADPDTQEIPVIVASADATPGQVKRLLDAGARAYLTKPLDIRQLVAVIGSALGEVSENAA